jgi:hypothetical protein
MLHLHWHDRGFLGVQAARGMPEKWNELLPKILLRTDSRPNDPAKQKEIKLEGDGGGAHTLYYIGKVKVKVKLSLCFN